MFSSDVVLRYECWFEVQQNIWRAVSFGDKVSEMVFLRDFEARQLVLMNIKLDVWIYTTKNLETQTMIHNM